MNSFLARTRIARTLAFASVGLMMAGGIPRAGATPITWSNGVLVNTDNIVGCISGLIEVRMQGYIGYGLRPGGRTPAVGEVWYAHVVLSHPGNMCGGGSFTQIDFAPPPNTVFAAGNPVFCFYRRHDFFDGNFNSHGTLVNNGGSCNQNPPVNMYGYNLGPINPSQTYWPVPNYSWLEFLVPLRSSAVVSGSNAVGHLNPDIGVNAFPSKTIQVNSDVLFRDGFDGLLLFLDLCNVSFTTGC